MALGSRRENPRAVSETDKRGHLDAENLGGGLLEALRRRERNVELRIACHAPATVVTYDPATSRADIVLGHVPVLDLPAGDVPQAPVKIPNVRVAWDQDSGGYDTRPLAAGDTGEVSFHDRALDEWYRKGGSVDPVDGRTHSLADAVFRPGLATDAGVITPPTDQTARVIEHTQIKLGRLATLAIARATDPVAPNALMLAWALVVETAINALAPGTFTPANSFAGTLAASMGAVASGSTKTKAE